MNLGEKLVWASQGYGKERSYLHYIEIPIHLRFKYTRLNGMEDYVAPFVFGGPSFSILAAHSNVKALKYAGGEMGLTVGLGVEIFKNWQVQASRTWGMVYAVKTKLLDDFSAKNRTWDIRVVYPILNRRNRELLSKIVGHVVVVNAAAIVVHAV